MVWMFLWVFTNCIHTQSRKPASKIIAESVPLIKFDPSQICAKTAANSSKRLTFLHIQFVPHIQEFIISLGPVLNGAVLGAASHQLRC